MFNSVIELIGLDASISVALGLYILGTVLFIVALVLIIKYIFMED